MGRSPRAEPEGGGARKPPTFYCLRCYQPFELFKTSKVCECCGHINLRVDQRIFWTQEKRFRDLEELAKAVVVVIVGLMTLAMFQGRGGFGMGQGYAVGAPLLTAVVLWETASKITRKKPYFRASIIWAGLVGVIATFVLSFALFAEDHVPLWARGAALLLAVALFGATYGTLRLGHWLLARPTHRPARLRRTPVSGGGVRAAASRAPRRRSRP